MYFRVQKDKSALTRQLCALNATIPLSSLSPDTTIIPVLTARCRAAGRDLWHFCRKIGADRFIFGQIGASMQAIVALRPTSAPQIGVDG